MNRKRLGVLAIFIGILLTARGLGFADGIKAGAHGGLSIPNIRGSETDLFSRGFKSRQGRVEEPKPQGDLRERIAAVMERNERVRKNSSQSAELSI